MVENMLGTTAGLLALGIMTNVAGKVIGKGSAFGDSLKVKKSGGSGSSGKIDW